MGLCCFMPLAITLRGSDRTVEWLAKLELGQTPPAVLGVLAFHGEEFDYGNKDFKEILLCCCFGLFCWTIGALGLWALVSARFNVLTNRSSRSVQELTRHRLALQPASPLPAEPVVLDAIPMDAPPSPDVPPRSPS